MQTVPTADTERAAERRPGDMAPEALKRIEAWLSLPRSDRAELLRGRIVYKAMAGIDHGAAGMNIGAQLDRFQGPPNGDGGGWWLSQDVDMFLAGQGLRPDLVGWRVDKNPRLPHKVNIGDKHLGVYVTPPDWVCEVLSGSTKTRDEEDGVKWRAYHEAGVSHYWLVDLSRERILVHRRGDLGYELIEEAGRESTRPLSPFDNLAFQAGRVFLLAGIIKAE